MAEEPRDLPGDTSEVQDDAPRTSSTAQEVEEEIIAPKSPSTEESTAGPAATSSDGREDSKENSLSPSAWGEPQGLSPSDMSSRSPERSGGLWSSAPSSPTTSPLPWRTSQGGLRPLDEEDGGPARQEPPSPAPKKKVVAKKGAMSHAVRPIVPAEKSELLAVAKAMHRDSFGRNVKELFHLEREAALRSLETGLYIGWRCPEYLWDCFRVGDESKCFCGHLLKQHQIYVERRATVPCTRPACPCQSFTFVPSRPEEVGEFWLQRRTGFDPAAWRARCRCKHTHEEHAPLAARACGAPGCSCTAFASSFLCAACDRRWEEHETFFESEETRLKGGRPCGTGQLGAAVEESHLPSFWTG